ncbi:phage late control D family protein [Aliiroseovarius lamellibrachiae]|uniref:phage late control D family protein n=1 Tax=Aliiroseovarius lamellibrachiae TaxID=1924933 RepID=UPI001BDFA101|nr:contractile injection system protein, VgrG/Pvc8 family [Aliiroseovarius lamellibrachiae]MBT2130134.1 late control protein D [Aliiroseovarius lamellibrachiae]
MTHPKVLVDIDGVPVSGLFFKRLVKLSVTDREGIQSDALEMTFNDDEPHFASPRRGAVASVTIQSGDVGFAGSYIIDRVDHSCLPYTITVGGHSADLRSEMKTGKSRHWDDVSVKEIVAEIAADHGLKSKISDVVSGHVYSWIGQQDESDLHFLRRLAKRHGALFTIKNGTLLWLELGAGKTADGTVVPSVKIVRTEIILGTCKTFESDVDRFGAVKAFYQDRGSATRQEIVVKGDPEADGEHVIRDPFSSKEEAQAAAEAYVKEMLRGLMTTSCSIVGRPSLMAGQPISYFGVRPGIDGREFITELVKHTYTKKGGVRTSFDGKLRVV